MLNKFIHTFFYFTNKILILKMKKMYIDHPLLTSQPQKKDHPSILTIGFAKFITEFTKPVDTKFSIYHFFFFTLFRVYIKYRKKVQKKVSFIETMNLLPLKKSCRQVYNNAFMTAGFDDFLLSFVTVKSVL